MPFNGGSQPNDAGRLAALLATGVIRSVDVADEIPDNGRAAHHGKARYCPAKSAFRIIGDESMAKKAKRRGRPPGSKNKNVSVGKLTKDFAKMEVGELRSFIGELVQLLATKVQEQREFLEGQLAQLGGYVTNKASAAVKAVTPSNGKAGKRAKPKPKYQSKKDKSLKWSGRGMTPVWMREEMKGTKLKKDDFLIS
jgi:DNA-binding protein H-NS